MGKWTTELKSGKHKQAKGVLKDGDSWCCLGLREEIVEGMRFHKVGAVWYDENNAGGMVVFEKLEEWNLTDKITDQERIKITKLLARGLTDSWKKREWVIRFMEDLDVERSMLLAGMNDNGFTFKQIGTLIEKMGWDNSDD